MNIPRIVAAIAIASLCTMPAASASFAQPTRAEALRTRVREHRTAREREIVRELVELLAIPNVASDRANIRRNADHLVGMLRRRGVETRLLELGDTPPAVYGELRAPGATRTIVFYAHYDGQPVDATQWAIDPWHPVLRAGPLLSSRVIPLDSAPLPMDPEWRVYARSASDDKSPIVAALVAIDALRAARVPLSVNVKFFLEGEEEAGSSNLRPMLERYRELLHADAWIFADGPVHQTRRMQVVFGVRGVLGLDLTTYGPTRALHSGHYGNWAPNPIALLVDLLASMRDGDGAIRISGFDRDVRPISEAERRAIAEAPAVDSVLRRSLGLAWSEAGGAPLAERIMRPALNLRGIRSGAVGAQAANAIPTEATASIDFRLVPDQTPERVRAQVEEHIGRQGYHIVRTSPDSATRAAHPRIARVEWEGGYPATRTAMELPVSRAVVRVLEEGGGGPIIKVPTLGGSLPMHVFGEVLRAPLLVVPMVNHDNNQHAANENLRLQNLWDGIETYAAIFARLGQVWR